MSPRTADESDGGWGVLHESTSPTFFEAAWAAMADAEGEYEAALSTHASCRLIGRGDAAKVARYLIGADVYVCNSEIES